MPRQIITTANAPASSLYSQGVKAGPEILVSGMVGIDPETAYAEIPPRVEYDLTPLGDSLRTVVTALAQWATDHDDEIKTARRAFDNR